MREEEKKTTNIVMRLWWKKYSAFNGSVFIFGIIVYDAQAYCLCYRWSFQVSLCFLIWCSALAFILLVLPTISLVCTWKVNRLFEAFVLTIV